MQSHVVALDFSSSSNTFLAPEGPACVCHSGVTLCSSGLGHGLRYSHVPEKNASVKCLDAVLGKVHLPCWRFIVVRNGPRVVFNLSFCVCGVVTELLPCSYLTMHGKFFFRVCRWFRQARQPLLTACGGMAKSARCCSPRPSRRFAKRVMEQWTLHSQGTIAFHLHTLRVTILALLFFFTPRAPVLPTRLSA